jgi:4-amino-4-deoxy-L-arabinose transferase-like glycosyltransferase
MKTLARFLDHPKALVTVIAIGAFVRLLAFVGLAARPLSDDAHDYYTMGVSLARGELFDIDWPPGVPYLLFPLIKIFGEHEIIGRVAMLGVHAAFATTLYLVARKLAGLRAAILSAFAFAIAPSFVFGSVTPLTQLPTATLILLALWLALSLTENPSVPRGLMFGLVTGLLILVRPSNVALGAALLGWLAWTLRKVKPAAAGAATAAAAVLLVAWTVQAHELCGRWMFINNANSQNLYYGNNPWTPTYKTWWFGSHKYGEPGVPLAFVEDYRRLAATPAPERNHAFSQAAIDHIKDRPDLFILRSVSRVRTFLAFDTFAGAQLLGKGGGGGGKMRSLLGLGVIALDALVYLTVLALVTIRLFVIPIKKNEWLLLAAALLYSAPYFVSFSHPTYHLPVTPVLAVLGLPILDHRLRGEPCLPPPASRGRMALFVTLLALVAIQVEWVLASISRLS